MTHNQNKEVLNGIREIAVPVRKITNSNKVVTGGIIKKVMAMERPKRGKAESYVDFWREDYDRETACVSLEDGAPLELLRNS